MSNFSAISWPKQVTFQWDDNDVHLVLIKGNNKITEHGAIFQNQLYLVGF